MVRNFRTAADIAVASSAVCAVFGAALAYPTAAPTVTAMAFVTGYCTLLFLLPFSVFALEFLRPPRGPHQTPRSILACAVATPVALLAAILAVLPLATRSGGGDNVALAAGAIWVINVAAVTALRWCLTNGGFTAVAFNRMEQFSNFMEAMERTPEIGHHFIVSRRDPAGERRKAVCFVVAVSAACAAAGGAAVGALSAAGGLSTGAAAAVILFALPMCLLYVPEYLMDPEPTVDDGVLRSNPMVAWYVLLAPVGLVLARLVAAIVMASSASTSRDLTFAAITVTAAAVWAVDAISAVLLGQHIAREIRKPSIYRASSSEIASGILIVGVRYFLYLHVFRIIGCGGQLIWFNSAL